LIVDGESGLLTNDAWNIDEIAAALQKLAADAVLRSRIGAAGRLVVEKYTWDRTAAETMRVYEEVVGVTNKPKRVNADG
jgi:D-inositol-3-phosphate glycosyltransferase